MTNKERKTNPISTKQNMVVTRKEEDIALKQQLLNAPELYIYNKGGDEYLDRLSLKIKLIGGREFSLREYVSENIVEYRSRFYKEYYYQIARLYGFDNAVMDKYQKPECAAQFTVQFIYGRFPRKVLNAIRKKSPWSEIPGVRENKLFQFLTPVASEELDLYIEQAVETMKTSNTLLDFQLTYSQKYRVYFQLDMFEGLFVHQ